MSLLNRFFGKKRDNVKLTELQQEKGSRNMQDTPLPNQPQEVDYSKELQVDNGPNFLQPEDLEEDSEPSGISSTGNRSIRVFVSSTFIDMIEDRNELMTHCWPELRKFCSERHVELTEVDLRWGISEEQNNRKETLKL